MSNYLITGANRGLGLEFVRQLLARNDSVIACCREPVKAAALSALIKGAEGRLKVEALDVSSEKAIRDLPERLAGAKIDVLINNAGVAAGHEEFGHFEEATMAKVLLVNSIAPMLITQAVLPLMKASATKPAKIICISSILGSITQAADLTYGLTYGMSKAALNMGVKKLSGELTRRHAVIVALHPGWVKTDMGGAGADLAAEESIRGMLEVIDGLKAGDNGRYLTYEGDELAW